MKTRPEAQSEQASQRTSRTTTVHVTFGQSTKTPEGIQQRPAPQGGTCKRLTREEGARHKFEITQSREERRGEERRRGEETRRDVFLPEPQATKEGARGKRHFTDKHAANSCKAIKDRTVLRVKKKKKGGGEVIRGVQVPPKPPSPAEGRHGRRN